MVELINALIELIKLIGPWFLLAIIAGVIWWNVAETNKLKEKANVSQQQTEERESEADKKRAEADAETRATMNRMVESLQQRLNDQNAHLIQQAEEMARMRDKVEAANKQHEGDQRRIEELVAENAKRKEENKQTTAQVDSLNAQIGELKTALDNKNAEATRLTEEKRILAEANAALQLQLTIQQEANKLLMTGLVAEIKAMRTGETPVAPTTPEVTPAVAESPAPQTI